MKPFPKTFATKPILLNESNVGTPTKATLLQTSEKGFYIQIGLHRSDAPHLQQLSTQPSIRHFCPRDCTDRFKDLSTTSEWLSKGRLVFVLKNTVNGEIAGLAWAGPGHTGHIKDSKITISLRIYEAYQGQGLATPFLKITINYVMQNYPEQLLWLECWQSNTSAVHIYQKLGFATVSSEQGYRQTPGSKAVQDTRLYMQLLHSLLGDY